MWLIISCRNQIKSLEAELQSKKQRIEILESELIKEVQENVALNESCDKYEDKIREVEKKMKDNLNKEASRRREAEYSVTRLKVIDQYSRYNYEFQWINTRTEKSTRVAVLAGGKR